MGVKGSLYQPPPPSNYPEIEPSREIDIGFKELRSSLKFAMMISGEHMTKYTYSRFHFFGLVLGGDAETPLGILFQNTKATFGYFGGDISIGYRLIKKNKLELDATVGFKWAYADFKGSTESIGLMPYEFRVNRFLWDPALGMHIAWRPISRLEFKGFGDIGLVFNERLTYQWLVESNFFISPKFFISLGYRVWHIDGEREDIVFSGELTGPITRIGFQFGRQK